MMNDVTPDQLLDVRDSSSSNEFVADVSDFKRGQFDPARGLIVRSGNGNRVVYWVKRVEVDVDNDIMYWELVSWTAGYPRITIFND